MHVSTMRYADRWLGVPVCILLTLIRYLWRCCRRPVGPSPRRIIFIKLAEQGSTVLAASAIRRAVELVGRSNVFFLVLAQNRAILDVMDLIPPGQVITIGDRGLADVLTSAIAAIRRIRNLNVDTAIDLEFFARSTAALSYLVGAGRRVGFHAFRGEGPYRGDLMTHRLRFNSHLPTAQMFRLMAEAMLQPADRLPTFPMQPITDLGPPIRITPNATETEEVRSLVRTASGRESCEPLILLNPNCSDRLPLRRWPGEHYVELAQRMLDRYPQANVAMTGDSLEQGAIADLVNVVGSDRCFSLAGRTDLRQLLVVFELAELLVTNDSGPAHFGALTGIDVVVLFGPESPHLFAPPTPRLHVFWQSISCSPCVSALNNRISTCHDNICMQQISVASVFEKTCRIYEARMGIGCKAE